MHMQELSDNTISDISPQSYKIKQYQPPSLLSQFSYMLIRPPRFLYGEQLLNPPEKYSEIFKIQQHNIPFKLTIYAVKNMLYVILYLHGNSSSRFEGYMHLKQLPEGVGLACFDFQGCGNRDGEFVTLGLREAHEIDIAAQYIKNLGYRVVGWGRSMGSVGLLLSEVCDVIVADSPFASLKELCRETASKFVPSYCCCLFHCFFPCVFACVKSDVEQRAKFKINELQIAQKVSLNPRNKQRSLFLMAGTEDMMIDFTHSQAIFQQFKGNKWLQLFPGSHNSQRPSEVYDKCFEWIQRELKIERKKKWSKSVDIQNFSKTISLSLSQQNIIKQNKNQNKNEPKQCQTELTTINNILISSQKNMNNTCLTVNTEQIKVKSQSKQQEESLKGVERRKQQIQIESTQQIPVVLMNQKLDETKIEMSSITDN